MKNSIIFFIFLSTVSLSTALGQAVFQSSNDLHLAKGFERLEKTLKNSAIIQKKAYFLPDQKDLYIFETAIQINQENKLETYEFQAKLPAGEGIRLTVDYLDMDVRGYVYRAIFDIPKKWTVETPSTNGAHFDNLIFTDHERIQSEINNIKETSKEQSSTAINSELKLQQLLQQAQSTNGLRLRPESFLKEPFEYYFKVDANGLISEMIKSRFGKVMEIVHNRKASSFDFIGMQKKVESGYLSSGVYSNPH